MNTSKLTLEDFIKKATDKYNNRKMVIEIEIEGMGMVTFTRPSENQILTYMSKNSKAVQGEEGADGKRKVTEMNFNLMLESSRELVFHSCAFLKNPELQASLDVIDGYDVVTKVFGVNKTIDLANEISDAFGDTETEEEVKN
ncbi:hypothetical protein [Clostridium sp. FP1]|uniref:hypothetical protein n=1 Tax=Clostridium sp. FP1 TaxID=2724076 RepID=UPI0013E978AE|nr:hypothetical protein [Clostridium sp. FP1]MBZ9633192.1 hypothetical protein [Clostridium sp. FP1]